MVNPVMLKKILLPLYLAWKHQGLLGGFVSREICGRFAGTMAGTAWALINPLATMLVYMFVFSMVLRVSVTAEETGTDSFFIYFVTGFVPWLIFAEGLTRATGSVLENASIVTKVVFPVELLPVTSIISAFLINGLGFVILLLYMAYHGFASPVWVLLMALIPFQVLFTLGMGMFFSAACVYLRDIKEMTGLILMVWFFSTPVIYPLSMVPENIQNLIRFNPMCLFVNLYRDVLISHSIDLINALGAMLATAGVYAAGSIFFARVKPGFGDVL